MLHFLSRTHVRSRRVVLRVDFNVPITGGQVEARYRLAAHLPTIARLLRDQNRVIMLSHHTDPRQTLRPVAKALSRLIRRPVRFLSAPQGVLPDVPLALVENLRRWPGEVGGSPAFARVLARLGEVFVNDAFGVAHREGASLTLLPRLLPAYAGLLLERELRVLGRVRTRPSRPLVAIIGGAKIETKLKLIERFCRVADRVVLGGAVANEVFRVRRGATPPAGIASATLRRISRSPKIVLPVDLVRKRGGGRSQIIGADAFDPAEAALDVGPRSIRLFASTLRGARMIVWNGTMGVVEQPRFAVGTAALAHLLVRLPARVIVGGGDTVSFLERQRLTSRYTFVSTGGGAMLAYLSGEPLPAVRALEASTGIRTANGVLPRRKHARR